MHNMFLHVPGERLSGAELSAARLDGDVVELGEAYAPADLVETAALRIASLAPLVRGMPGAAFAGMSAAWIHGAGDAPPAVHELQSATQRRLRGSSTWRVLVHDPALEPEDVQRFGTLAVATAERTLIDLLRWPSTVADRRPWALALARADPGLAARAAIRLSQIARGPGRHRAERFLAELIERQG
ncbi:SAM-dependent methyltransferase [Microbacterium panaciterrae]|uniref:AbiEi antitoxin C-terminal domain-containing protein n=1 Tax=Microbacterium panaciterrae TaxID=985759 RepID=A0ABP8P8S6_9MICO